VLASADAIPNTSFGADDVERWHRDEVELLESGGILCPAEYATTVVCPGCHEHCLEEVEFIGGSDEMPLRAYVVCERRDDIGRVPVPLARLRRWTVNLGNLSAFLAQELGAVGGVEEVLAGRLWWLGRVSFRAGGTDVFMARGVGSRRGAEEVGVTPRFQQCSRAVLLTLGDTTGDLFPGKVAISLQRLLSIQNGELRLDLQAIKDEVARRAGRSVYPVRRFPTPPGTTWEQVSILILAEGDGAQISAGGIAEPVTPAEMGMAYARNPARYTKDWNLLLMLAKCGRVEPRDAEARVITSKQVERLRKKLQRFFGIEGDPFKPYRQVRGYEPRFSLTRISAR